VLDTLTGKDCQEAFQKWRRKWDRCLHTGGNYFDVDRPYGEFYDFYSVSPEYLGYNLLSYRVIISVKLFGTTEIFTMKILGNFGLTLLRLQQRKNQGAPAAFHTLGFSYLLIHG
jgi:hypothetical protein